MFPEGLRQASTERIASPQVASQSGETIRAPSSSGEHSGGSNVVVAREEAERARLEVEEGGRRKGFLREKPAFAPEARRRVRVS